MKTRKNIIIVSLMLVCLLILPALPGLAAPPTQTGELAIITYPADNEVVRGIISVTGSAIHPQFQRYEMSYALEPILNDGQWVGLGQPVTQQVVSGELAIWDTTGLIDGSYTLRLRVVKLDGNYNESIVRQVVVANTQPTETPTPDAPATPPTPTVTPTPLPPTPTIIIEVPVDETATPRPLTVTQTLPTPRPEDESLIPIPEINIDSSPFMSACLWGGGAMLVIFLFFGFLSLLRYIFLGVVAFGKRQRK